MTCWRENCHFHQGLSSDNKSQNTPTTVCVLIHKADATYSRARLKSKTNKTHHFEEVEGAFVVLERSVDHASVVVEE